MRERREQQAEASVESRLNRAMRGEERKPGAKRAKVTKSTNGPHNQNGQGYTGTKKVGEGLRGAGAAEVEGSIRYPS